MIVGYARTSTTEQSAGLEAQLQELKQAGCEKLYQEQVSSVSKREHLDAALEYVRAGDTFVVTKIDRVARSMRDLMDILHQLEEKGVSVRILNLSLDTQAPTGKLIVNVLGCVAQFEREMMLERQRDGIAKAKNEGKYKGRKPKTGAIREEVLRLKQEGLTKAAIASQVGVGVATVYRLLASEKSVE